MKRAEGNLLMAANMRKLHAERLFKIGTVAVAIDQAAFEGHRHYRIVQDVSFDLSESEAARTLETWLVNEEFHFIWRATYIEQDGLRVSHVTEYPELVILW